MACIVRVLAIGFVLAAALHAGPAEARRVALVIGNASYKVGPLANPVSDASAMAAALGKLGFDKVILKRNLNIDGFRAALGEMARESAGAELGLVYFAGHGTEVGGRNFLVPVDAILGRVSALDLEAIPLDTVLAQLDGVKKLKLVILDACRNNVFAPSGAKRSVGRGLARVEPEDNTMVVYAAKDGTTADDGVGGRHSPFTEALLKHIATPGLEINLLFRRVRDDVIRATSHETQPQQPHVYASLGGQELYLSPGGVPAAVAAPSLQPPVSDVERAWAAAKDSTSIAALEAFRRQHGASNAFYDRLARTRIEELKKQAAAPVAPKPALPEIGPAVSPPIPSLKAPETAIGRDAAVKCCHDVYFLKQDRKYAPEGQTTPSFWSKSEIVLRCTQTMSAASQAVIKNICDSIRFLSSVR